jgi:ribosomal protein L6P/L9E
MSRIGNRILTIPAGVEVKIEPGNVVTVKGSKGELKQTFSTLIDIKVDGTELSTVRQNEDKHTKQLHGTTNSLLEGMLTGVSAGFVRELEIVGVGYRAALAGNALNLSLGFTLKAFARFNVAIKVLFNPLKVNLTHKHFPNCFLDENRSSRGLLLCSQRVIFTKAKFLFAELSVRYAQRSERKADRERSIRGLRRRLDPRNFSSFGLQLHHPLGTGREVRLAEPRDERMGWYDQGASGPEG